MFSKSLRPHIVHIIIIGMIVLLPFTLAFAQENEQASGTDEAATTEQNAEVLNVEQQVIEGKVNVFVLGKIEVVGQADKVEPAARSTVTVEEFDAKLNENVLEALEQVPGMYGTVGQKNESEIFMRGFRQGRTLVLYDGVPLTAPYYGDLDSAELSLENLAEIKVVRGNASVLYGPNAVAGVVSLVSAKPTEEPNLRVLATVDQESNYTARISHGQKMGLFYYQISAGLRNSNGWPLSDDFETTYDEDGYVLEDGDIRENSAFHQWSAGLKLGLDWGMHEISFSSTYTDAEKEIPPATSDLVSVRYWEFPEWKKTTNVLAGRSQLTEKVDLRANLFYHTYDNVLRNYYDNTYEDIKWESTYDDYSTGLLTRLAWQLSDKGTIRASVQGVIDNHRAQSDVGDPWEEYKARTYAFLGEGEWRPTPLWTVQLGAGLEQYAFDSADNLEVEDNAIADRAEDIDALTWSLGAIYLLNERHTLSGAVSKKNRFPTMHQLFSNLEEVDPSEITTIDTEQALEYQLSYSFQQNNDLQFGTAAFYYDLTDMIDRENQDALYSNIQKAAFKGLELWGDYRHDSGLMGRLSYTFLQATNETSDAAYDDLPFTPENLLHLDLGYICRYGTTITLGYSYKDSVIEYDNDDNAVDIPEFSLWDLTVRHDFKSGLSFTLQALNLLDENYYLETGYECPGRVIKLGIQYKI